MFISKYKTWRCFWCFFFKFENPCFQLWPIRVALSIDHDCLWTIFSAAGGGEGAVYCDEHVCLSSCVSVCLLVCEPREPHVQTAISLRMLCPPLTALRYVNIVENLYSLKRFGGQKIKKWYYLAAHHFPNWLWPSSLPQLNTTLPVCDVYTLDFVWMAIVGPMAQVRQDN